MTTQSLDVSIERFSEGDLPGLVDLTESSFGRKEVPAYYRWKYLNNPEGAVTAYVARTDDGRLAAFYGAVPEAYYLRGTRLRMYQSCDTMTHPEFRRRGLFERLAKKTYEELASRGEYIVKGFAGEMSVSGFTKKLEWQLIERIKPRFMVRLQVALVTSLRPLPRRPTTLVEGGEAPEDVRELDAHRSREYPIWKARDPEYLNWRMRDPRQEHRMICCYLNDRLIGYCMYCVEGSILLIRDLVWEHGDEATAHELIRKVQSITLLRGLRGLYCWTNRDSAQDQFLARLGFIMNPFNRGPMVTPLYFIMRVNSLAPSPSLMLTGKSWNLLPIDYDF